MVWKETHRVEELQRGYSQGSNPFGEPARHYNSPISGTGRQVQGRLGRHSMRLTLADRIVAGRKDFYCPIVRVRGISYHVPKDSRIRHDHANTLRGQLKAGGLTKERKAIIYRALEIIGESAKYYRTEFSE